MMTNVLRSSDKPEESVPTLSFLIDAVSSASRPGTTSRYALPVGVWSPKAMVS